ncbi:FTFMHR domain-containing protein [Aspergillus lucknowensis]|uniref:C2H2-type domain-containing protein n=1 Tax=Aspergillus lucknowensis TaxID=176173 RepID=A0ABR4M378_9EURO
MVVRKCNICDRRFKKTEHFKRHERSHTKEKPYECNVCHKRFSRSDVLSRHAKGHNTNGAAANATSPAQNKPRTSSIAQPSNPQPAPNPVDPSRYIPMNAGDAHASHNLPVAPRDISLSGASNLPSSSLDFLADISAHQARSEPDVNANSMIVEDQQAYFGWNEVPAPPPPPLAPNATDQQTYRTPMFDPVPNDMLQFWLEPRGDTVSHHDSIDMMADANFSLMGDNVAISPEHQTRAQANEHTGKTTKDIPNERFARVQRFWLAPSNTTGRLMNSLWRDVACSDVDNIFSIHSSHSFSSPSGLLPGSRYGLDEECRQQLQAAFGSHRATGQTQSPNSTLSPTSNSTLGGRPNFPPAEILDMALDLYFRNFHPLIPFVHVPTFSAKNTRLPVLNVMCLIGMIMLGTKGTTAFVSKNFVSVLEKITADLTKCSVGVENTMGTMSTFAAAFLFLNLAAMTGEKEHLEKSQMLYVNLMSIAQRHGLFAATEGQILDITLFEAVPDIDVRWKTWSKVESVKRLITGLLLLDSWYSSFLSTGPIIVPNSIQLILPCNETLFRANGSMRWTQLVRSGKRLLMPTVMAPSENVTIPPLDNPVDDFCIHGVLAMVQLRLSEAYHRLLSNRASYPFAPCHTYAMDGRARCLPSLQLQIADKYGDVLERLNPNAAIMWHNICMTLTADTQIFDLAAGRAGPGPARKALDDIAAWSQTPAARRACLHAAHIYKAMTNRKASDHTMFHSVFSLFSAALVLGLYIFMVPNPSELQVGGTSIELLDDIDWKRVGTEGFTSFMEPRGTQSFTPSDDPAVNFIRNGGTVYFRGVPFQGGYQSARRILLDYAGLLKDAGKWSVRKFSYVLHIMSDVLMEVE